MNRRKLRATYQLVAWAEFWLTRPNVNARDIIPDMVRSIFNAGRRRGRHELGREIVERLGLAQVLELEYAPAPSLRVTPLGHVGTDTPVPSTAQRYVVPELPSADPAERLAPLAHRALAAAVEAAPRYVRREDAVQISTARKRDRKP